MSYSSINRVVLVGRLTRDPELRALPSGRTLCSLRVACNSLRKDPDGSYREKPNFFNVSVFGGHAESVSRYMRKGSRIGIDGRLEWSEWETADGSKRQAVDVVAGRIEFLDSPGGHLPDGGTADGAGEDDPGEEPGRELAGVGAGIEDDIVF
jgi:single-strand DNA-binding protein